MMYFFFFFKQKTAYEMRISDWSSDVCSSDLQIADIGRDEHPARLRGVEPHIDDDLRNPFLDIIEEQDLREIGDREQDGDARKAGREECGERGFHRLGGQRRQVDRKSTRLNSSH